MRWVGRILLGVVVLILLVGTLIVGSVVVDGMLGRTRIDALVNTAIENPAGPAVRAYVATPPGPGPHPAVIMLHEWWGLQAALHGKADALTAQGFVVVVPDTYRGVVTRWIPRAIYQVVTTPEARVNQDLDAVFDWLAAQPSVDATRIAVMGFCYGGGKALAYSLHSTRVAATGIFYGGLVTDPAELRRIPGPVLGIFGGADTSIPLSEVNAFASALEAVGVPHQISIYEGQPHAFVTDIEAIRRGGAQGEAWAELVGFLNDTLLATDQN